MSERAPVSGAASIEWVLQAALSSGLDARRADGEPDAVDVSVPFEYGRLNDELPMIASIEAGHLVLRLVLEVADIDFDRLEDVSWLPVGVEADACPLDALVDGEVDDVDVLQLVAVTPVEHLDVGLSGAVTTVSGVVTRLVDDGLVMLVDACADAGYQELLVGAIDLRARSPRAAIERLLEAAAIARSLGSVRHAALAELGVAEIRLGLGEVATALEIAERAWIARGAHLDDTPALVGVASARARHGDIDGASGLLERARADAVEDGDAERAAVLGANLGVLRALTGDVPGALRDIDTTLDRGLLGDFDRAVMEEQREAIRVRAGAAARSAEPTGVIERTEHRLTRVQQLFNEARADRIDAVIAQIDELLRLVELDLPALGPSATGRLEAARGARALLTGDRAAAVAAFERAVIMLRRAGDLRAADSIELQRLAAVAHGREHAPSGVGAMEQVAFHTNAALIGIGAVAAIEGGERRAVCRWHLEQAVGIADRMRSRFVQITDRRAWRSLLERCYVLSLAYALADDDSITQFELLERLRAQGVPRSDVDDVDVRQHGQPGSVVVDGVRAALGDLPTGPLTIVSPRMPGADRDDGASRIPVGDALETVVGPAAWWWSCHLLIDSLFWIVRRPDGELSTGVVAIEGGAVRLEALAATFGSLTGRSAWDDHPLCADRAGRLDQLLDELAAQILPEPLRTHLGEAARRNDPIDLVWAAPEQLAVVPIGLLPVSTHHRVLDGARMVLMPPSGLVAAAETRPKGQQRERPAIAVLGADPDLGDLGDLVTALGLPAPSVLGGPRAVAVGSAERIASPDNVRRAMVRNREAVLVYYGHVRRSSDMVLSIGMSLCDDDGIETASLTAADLLEPDRRGAPHAVVLAGCSSLSADRSGTGEWWGISTGLLWQGAGHVIGSAWDLINAAPTRSFATSLVEVLRAGERPHVGLHALQLHAMHRWAAGRRSGSVDDDDRPYHWAGWWIMSAAPQR